MKTFNTIDAEVAGEAVRLIVGGAPTVQGRTMADKRVWLRRHGDGIRRLLMNEPRGHAGMHGAMLTEPVSGHAHAGLLFMHAGGFPALSGEAVIAAATIGVERGLIAARADETIDRLDFDTPAGPLHASIRRSGDRVASVAVAGLTSYVQSAGLQVRVGGRTAAVDIAFGGELYAIADSEAVGIPLEMANTASLIKMGLELSEAIGSGIQGVIFTGAPRDGGDLRSATVLEDGVLRRSPGIAGTAALLAVLDAMGLLADDAHDHRFIHEGILGTTLQARVNGRAREDDRDVVHAIVEGSATVTGFHEFVN
jgi:proline racemase